jgi:hypothetical protein
VWLGCVRRITRPGRAIKLTDECDARQALEDGQNATVATDFDGVVLQRWTIH